MGLLIEVDDRAWDDCMASLTRWTWVWVNSGSWWWTGRPGVLRFMGSQIVRHDWVTELNWMYLLHLWYKCRNEFRNAQPKINVVSDNCYKVISVLSVITWTWEIQVSNNTVNYWLLRRTHQERVCIYPAVSTQVSSFSHSLVSESLRPHKLQHARPLCLSPTPGVHPNSCPLSWWCHPAISSSVIPFSCSQSFSASGSFPLSQLFTSGGQSIGASVINSALSL